MSKPTNESVPWLDLVAAAKIMGIDPLPADVPLAEACEMFANAVEAVPPDQESAIDPMVVVIYNDVIIFKVPVTGHAESPAVEAPKGPAVQESSVSAEGGEGAVETPLPETTKGKKTAGEKEAAKAVKAKEKLEAKEKKAAEKAAEKAKKVEEKKSKKKEAGEPGSREKGEGFAAVLRVGILAEEPEGIVIQRAYEAYKAKGIPADKDDKWALARAKRTYHYIYAELVKQGRMVAKPKPVKEPKAPKEEKAKAAEAGEGAKAAKAGEGANAVGYPNPAPTTE